ncbi:hypothetical protein B0O99DRAFT_587797 [Bisporella sp. PMI_857]|nr:hypothetical protein B0O99DRAFT_587797 [Bisporella sp. PMI_857]
MYLHAAFVVFTFAVVEGTATLARRVPSSELVSRDAVQGWSLQSGSAPTSAHSCGNGAYCPINLHCNAMVNNHEVAACCSSSNDCRGEVEGAPRCADPSWNLWVGYDGNGFCCEAGFVGVYDITKSVAGTCVTSDNIGSLRTGILTSTGVGAAEPTIAVPPASSTSAGRSSTTAAEDTAKPTSSPASGSSGTAGTSLASTSTSSTLPTETANRGMKVDSGMGLVGVAFVAAALL